MGSIQSYLSSSSIFLVVVVTGAIGYGAVQPYLFPPQSPSGGRLTESETSASNTKKGKKKRQGAQSDTGASSSVEQTSKVTPIVVPFPTVIPGGFDSGVGEVDESAPKTTKPKKKKGKKAGSAIAGGGNRPTDAQSDSSATAPESYQTIRLTKKRSPTPKATPPVSNLDADGPWTRVETRRRATPADGEAVGNEGSASHHTLNASASDAGITTSVTGTSTPASEPTEDEPHVEAAPDHRRTLAEKLAPKARKTGVEDLLETPDVPTIARVMRVQPQPGERPATGFSWADYEDVDGSRVTADDADGEDEGGWVVQGGKARPKVTRTPSTQSPSLHASESLTKKQRQNAAKRDAQKAAKADAEAERLATLAKHKKEVENTRMAAQQRK